MKTGILINRKSGVPLHQQLTLALREAILNGSLAPGERLLSSREWQTHLGLSRNTVVDALGRLHAEGYLVTERGVGTFVAQHVHRRRSEGVKEARESVVPSRRAALDLSAQHLATNSHESTPFRPGIPALDRFPSVQFKRCFNAADWTARTLNYADPQGYGPLREEIASRLRQTRGVACSPDDLFLTNGAQAAFSLIVRVVLNPGDVAVVEDPGYPSVRATLLAHGARVRCAPVDRSGISLEGLARGRARLVYVTPSHQYPSGAVLSLERRFALIEWARERNGWIVEDDYDSEFNYTGRPQPALHGLADGRRILYVGTFSKVLSPALRVAYVVVPAALHGAFRAAQIVTSVAPDTIVQAALARFMNAGHLSRHITHMRKIYDERRRFVSAELRAAIPALQIDDSSAGLHFVARMPDGMSDRVLSTRAAQSGLNVPPLSGYYHGKTSASGLVIGFAATAIPEARSAIARLASLA